LVIITIMDFEAFAQSWVQAMNQGDYDALLELADPEIEVHFAEQAGGGVWGGDFKAVYRGLEGVRVASAMGRALAARYTLRDGKVLRIRYLEPAGAPPL
jgi:hypothetical protein